MTLSKALVPSQTLMTRVLMILGGSAFIAIAAQVSIGFPVPMTLQTLAVLIVGFAFGARMAALTLVAYLAEGAMGLPVFSHGQNFVAFFGPTAGFIFGFVGMAWLAGLAADLGIKGLVPTAGVALVLSALLYVPGVAWAMLADTMLGLDTAKWGADTFAMIWQYYMAPFLVGDAIKAVMAALVVSGGWAALKNCKA